MHLNIVNYDCTSQEYYYDLSSWERNYTLKLRSQEKDITTRSEGKNCQFNINVKSISNTQQDCSSISTMEFSFDSESSCKSNVKDEKGNKSGITGNVKNCGKKNIKETRNISVPEFVTKLLINSRSNTATARSSLKEIKN